MVGHGVGDELAVLIGGTDREGIPILPPCVSEDQGLKMPLGFPFRPDELAHPITNGGHDRAKRNYPMRNHSSEPLMDRRSVTFEAKWAYWIADCMAR